MSAQQSNVPKPSFTDTGTENDERTIPLGMGDLSAEPALDPLAGADRARKFSGGSLVLVIVVVMACGGLWFMRSLSKVSGATAGNTEVEASIEKFLSTVKSDVLPGSANTGSDALSGAHAGVLAVLSGSYTERQVPLENVKCNPFIIYGESPVSLGSDPDLGAAGGRRAQLQAQIEKAANQLELKSVLMGNQPLANIGGKIVRVGEEILTKPDNFPLRVTEITADTVTVLGEDVSLGLHVSVTLILKRDN